MFPEGHHERPGTVATAGTHLLLSLTAIGSSKGLSLLRFLLLGSLQKTHTHRSVRRAGTRWRWRFDGQEAHHLDTITRKGTHLSLTFTFEGQRM